MKVWLRAADHWPRYATCFANGPFCRGRGNYRNCAAAWSSDFSNLMRFICWSKPWWARDMSRLCGLLSKGFCGSSWTSAQTHSLNQGGERAGWTRCILQIAEFLQIADTKWALDKLNGTVAQENIWMKSEVEKQLQSETQRRTYRCSRHWVFVLRNNQAALFFPPCSYWHEIWSRRMERESRRKGWGPEIKCARCVGVCIKSRTVYEDLSRCRSDSFKK